MLDSETATHIGVLKGKNGTNPGTWANNVIYFMLPKGKSYDEPERAKWNDSEKRVLMVVGVNSHLGRKNKHFKRDCPKNKEVDNKRLNVNKVSTEGTELVDGTVAARVDLLDGKLVHALLDSGTEITVIKKDLVPGISVEGASTIYLKGIFGPAVKCPLVYVPIGLATGGQVKVVHQQVLGALAEVLVEDVLLPPEVLDMLGGAQSEENSLAQSSRDLRVDSGNVDETEVSSGILPEKAQEHIEDSQRNITSCRNEVGTLGTKDEEVTAEMDKGIMVADSFRSEQECCAELALVWKYAKEGKGNYYEVDGYLFRRDKILGESIGQLVIPKCRTEVLKLAHTSVFSSHMGPKKTIKRIKYSFFWEGLRADVKKFCESCKECQLTRSVRIKDRPPITPVARPELPFQVVNMDLIGPIDPPSSKGHKYILCLVDQHTRWGEAVPLTSLSAKVTCEAFVKLKELPCEVTSLATPDANLPFQVHCDASDYGVGCCLIQQDTEGIYRPIAFASQKFNATQKNWASIEKEAWAVLYGLNKFDKWIYGAKVEIISDHNPLKYLNQTTPKSPKLTRWALALQRWNHSITHRPGGACKELLPAPGNRSNKRRDREKDLATTEEEKRVFPFFTTYGPAVSWTGIHCPTPVSHGCDEVIKDTLGNTVPLLTKSDPPVLQATRGIDLVATCRSSVSQRRSIGLRSGQHASHFLRYWFNFKTVLHQMSCMSCQVIYSQFGLAIHQNDHQARRRFVEWAQNEIAVVPDFHKRILFSDEAHFWLNGYVNKQNCRIWSEANPQVYVETPLHPEKLTVWCALWAGGILFQKR
ncbi:retrovirus-related Pol polyprotein from transposon opus [Trichonephila clavipes]|nr:retrovirus-related Pol polyprotein from transposon opus [Trichonephila clavipes]